MIFPLFRSRRRNVFRRLQLRLRFHTKCSDGSGSGYGRNLPAPAAPAPAQHHWLYAYCRFKILRKFNCIYFKVKAYTFSVQFSWVHSRNGAAEFENTTKRSKMEIVHLFRHECGGIRYRASEFSTHYFNLETVQAFCRGHTIRPGLKLFRYFSNNFGAEIRPWFSSFFL